MLNERKMEAHCAILAEELRLATGCTEPIAVAYCAAKLREVLGGKPEKVLAEMLHDKKAQGGQITIIKVPGLGCWRAETIPVEGLRPLLGVEE